MTILIAACAPEQQQPVVASGEPARLLAGTFYTADGTALPYRAWLPQRKARAVVVALHGFNDYSNAFAMPALYFRSAGVALYAYDQRGFGAGPHPGIWGGKDNMTGDLRQFVMLVRALHPGAPLYILGESMGGAVAIAAVASPDFPRVDGLILSAPAIWGDETMSDLYRAVLWTMAHTVPFAEFTGSDLEILASNNIPMLRAMSKDPLVLKSARADAIYGLVGLMDDAYVNIPNLTVPVLMLYGSCDQVIPPEPIASALKRLKAHTRFAYYPGAYHMLLRDLSADWIMTDVIHWLRNHNDALPSGFEALDVNYENSLDRKACAALSQKASGSR